MPNPIWLAEQSQRTLNRLLPRLQSQFSTFIQKNPKDWNIYLNRLENHFGRLFGLLLHLYQDQYDFFYHLEELLISITQFWIDRPAALKILDSERVANPTWFQTHEMVGGVCYVDLFAGDLAGIQEKIPYFKELGLTYLHLMPLFKSPEGNSDGGYAISSYREVDPNLGTIEELHQLSDALRAAGISLVLDFVFNHTSDEHEWALKAKAGDSEYQEYYRMFPDRQLPDAHERHLREIFPDQRPGSFTYYPDFERWVWTTFNSFQWDLNYANPAVFTRMAEELLSIANVGVEVLRLDAVAFTWKEMGTNCENLPEAHMLIQAYNAVVQIAAPAMLFKSEAIVHPDEVIKYIAPEECQLSYNPLLMALLWNTLATRNIDLLDLALRERFKLDAQCAWVNYVRCHDDIGWTFSDEDAQRLNINGFDHRKFLNAFYTGRFEGSFARGLPFQENPKTGDVRISGSCASLAGLEKALREETETEVELAIRRISLIHGIIMTIGGIPLIYLNDEIGILNDYTYRDDPAKTGDSRWVHRPATNWDQIALRNDEATVEGRIYQNMRNFIRLRKSNPVFAGGEIQVISTGNPHVLGFMRCNEAERALVFANFSEEPHPIPANLLRLYGLSYNFQDMMTLKEVPFEDFHIEPYQFICLGG